MMRLYSWVTTASEEQKKKKVLAIGLDQVSPVVIILLDFPRE